MSKTLVAIFRMSLQTLRVCRDTNEARAQEPLDLALYVSDLGANMCCAKGRAQHVMFLIGEVANQGEDTLLYVLQAEE